MFSIRTKEYYSRDGNIGGSLYQYFKFSNEDTIFLRCDLIYLDNCLLPSLEVILIP